MSTHLSLDKNILIYYWASQFYHYTFIVLTEKFFVLPKASLKTKHGAQTKTVMNTDYSVEDNVVYNSI